MANIIQTRIKLRNATLAYWNDHSGEKILKGEAALALRTDGKYEIRIGTSDDSTWASLEPGNLVIPAQNVDGLLDSLYDYQLILTADGKVQLQKKLTTETEWTDCGDAIAVSSQYFEGEKLTTDASDDAAIARILLTDAYKAKTPRGGDTFVLKTKIVDGKDANGDATGAKYSFTAFTYDGALNAWKAMDGNYDARNVYMPEDITFTKTVGYLELESGKTKGTWDCDGLSVFDAIKKMVSKTVEPTAHNPSYSLAIGNITTYTTDSTKTTNKSTGNSVEAGTTVTKVAWNGTWTDGQFKLNGTKQKDAGCTPTYVMSNNKSATTSDQGKVDGTYTLATPHVVTDGSNSLIKITGKCTWSGSTATPTNNLGENNTSIKVAADSTGITVTDKEATLTGYRSYFYGKLDTDAALTSAMIRGLTNGGSYGGEKKFSITASSSNHKRFIIAIPSSSTRNGLKTATSTVGMSVDVTGSYVKYPAAVEVEGVNGYDAVDYDVWIWGDGLTIGSGVNHDIVLA